MEHSISFPLEDKVIIRFSCGARRWLGLISGFGALILIHWRGRDRILLGDLRVIVRQSAARDANAIQITNSSFYWCWHVICQAMRFQKLKAQMSAHCESSHLLCWWRGSRVTDYALAGGDYCTVHWQTPYGRSSWHAGSRKVKAPGTARGCSYLARLEKGKGLQFVLFTKTAWQ